jgi:hypothetical protein
MQYIYFLKNYIELGLKIVTHMKRFLRARARAHTHTHTYIYACIYSLHIVYVYLI